MTMKSISLMLACAVVIVAPFSAPSAWAKGNYYYYHVWMSDTDNPVYPKPGALASTLWDSFSYWPNWSAITPTLQVDPTADEVLAELSGYRDTIGEGDFLLFYYTGHGQRIGVNSSETEGTDLLFDIPPGSSGTTITTDILTSPDYFGGFAQGATVLTVFDMCYAGQMIGGENGFDITAGAIDSHDNTAVLAASLADEDIGLYAQNYEPWPSGNWDYVSSYFTQGIIEGLAPGGDGRPMADISGDGTLYADELFAFASSRTQEAGGSGGLFWDNIGSQELPVTTAAPTPEPSALVLLLSGGGSLLALYRHSRRTSVSR